jgi:hypothetical protein
MFSSLFSATTPAKEEDRRVSKKAKTPRATPKTPAQSFQEYLLESAKKSERRTANTAELRGMWKKQLDERVHFEKKSSEQFDALVQLEAANVQADREESHLAYGMGQTLFPAAAVVVDSPAVAAVVDSPPAVAAPAVVDRAAVAPVAYQDVAVMDRDDIGDDEFQPGTGVIVVNGKYKGEIGEVSEASRPAKVKISVHLDGFPGKPKLFFPTQLKSVQD